MVQDQDDMTDTITSMKIQQHSEEVQQLRREAAIQRIPVSRAVEDIKHFITSNESEDHLLVGFSSDSENPFKKERVSSACGCQLM